MYIALSPPAAGTFYEAGTPPYIFTNFQYARVDGHRALAFENARTTAVTGNSSTTMTAPDG